MPSFKYLKALYSHENNAYACGIFTALSLTCFIFFNNSIVALIPLVLFVALQFLLYPIAGKSSWRNLVDANEKVLQRRASRDRLLEKGYSKYRKRGPYTRYLRQYEMMRTRLGSMYEMALDPRANILVSDVERFEDMTINYLALLHSWLEGIDGSTTALASSDVNHNIAQLERQLNRVSGHNPTDNAQLRKAILEYKQVQERAKRRDIRNLTIEASLNTIPDKFEEFYHKLSAAPYGNDIGKMIEDSLKQLMLEEEVEARIELELSGASNESTMTPKYVVKSRKKLAAF